MTDINHEVEQAFASSNPIALRNWYVKNVVLAPNRHSLLVEQEPPSILWSIVSGQSPTPEHSGIAARLLYEDYGRRFESLQLPSIAHPKTWNQARHMSDLLMWAFQPWTTFRYDPKSETAVTTLPNEQWSFYLKGADSDNTMLNRIETMLSETLKLGFTTILEALSAQGAVSLNPADYKMDASDFANALQNSEAAFRKFLTRTTAIKETLDVMKRTPLMLFDTSTVNSMSGLAAFGNGVVPTVDILDYTPDGRDFITHPAGKLLPVDREYVLSSGGNLSWPTDPRFEEFVDFRYQIHNDLTTETWSDWVDAAQLYRTQILQNRCPTYFQFLKHAFPTTDNQIPEERDAFLRLLGAAVFGNNLKIVAAMIGAPNAGKDTVINWLSHLLGSQQVGVLSPMALTANFDEQRAFAPLKGAKIAVVGGEIGEGRSSALLAEKIKSVTSGGGTLTVAEKYEKPTTIYFDGMLIIQGNSVPYIQGGDDALYRNRLVAVEFKHPFPLQAKSYDHAYRTEAPYFLQVLFLAYCEYMERGGGMIGIAPPQAWSQFADDVKISADRFAAITRTVTPTPNPHVQIPSPVFYKALNILAQRTIGISKPLASQAWAVQLKKAGVSMDRASTNPWRSKIDQAWYSGYVFHFTLDADLSDGFFSQADWETALEMAYVESGMKVKGN